MKCKHCKKEISIVDAASIMGKKGGSKSVRKISPEEQERLQKSVNKAREKKKERKD